MTKLLLQDPNGVYMLFATSKREHPIVEWMVNWFRENFEPPYDVPHCDGPEAVYMFGGPVDPFFVLLEPFPGVQERHVKRAAEILYLEGGEEWVPKGLY